MVVPKAKGEILGVVIVESGWGSMLPTIVLANLCPTGPAARCGQLNIGDQVQFFKGYVPLRRAWSELSYEVPVNIVKVIKVINSILQMKNPTLLAMYFS